MLTSLKKTSRFVEVLPIFYACGFGIAGILLRTGFSEFYFFKVLHLAGLGLFALYLPGVLKEKIKGLKVVSDGTISFAIILAVVPLSFLPNSHLISFVFSFTGLLLGFLFIRKKCFAANGIYLVAILTILFIFFSICIVSIIWGGYHIRPTFIETLVVSKPYFFDQEFYNADTLYNLSIAHMIKNYGVASAGLDGIPSIYYHYGSHWMMAQLSRFTGIHLVHIYNFGYPLIFIPLFFHVFIQFVLEVQTWLYKKTSEGILFVLLLMCIFIRVPHHLYSGGLLGISALVNDSFIISLTLVFAFLHTMLLFWQTRRTNVWTFAFLSLVFVTAASLIKISSGFVLTGLIAYLFVRFNLYRQLKSVLYLLIVFAGFVFAYWITTETLPFGLRKVGGDEGLTQFFHFYKYTHTFEPISWFVGFYLWLYLVIVFVFALLPTDKQSSRLKFLWKSKMSLPAEICLVVAIVGVIPSIFMAFNGGNSMYFSGIQLFIAGAFMLAFVPALSEKASIHFSKLKKPLSFSIKTILVVSLLLLMYKEVRWEFNNMIKINVQTRREILAIPVEPEWRVKYDRSTFGIFETPVSSAYDTIKFGRFISALMEQENKATSSQLMFINQQTLPFDFFRNVRCIETSFIAPAFSGHAMLDGLSYNCGIGMYGDGYYKHNFTGTPNPSEIEICDLAAHKGFSRVVKYESTKNQFLSLDCNDR